MDSKILKILSRKFPNENSPSVILHISYLLASLVFCMLFNLIVINLHDFYNFDYCSIYKVLSGEAIRSIQYRVLIPYIFKAMSLILPLSDRALFILIIVIITYFTLLFFRAVLNVYFSNRTINSAAALFILYPMLWNFILMNRIFFFVDNAIMLFMTAGFYFIITGKNNWLLVTLFFSTLNHYSSGFIILAFVLFNYKTLFTKQTLMYAIGLSGVFIACFIAMKVIYPYFPPEKDDGFVVFIPDLAVKAVTDLSKGILLRDIFLNFGGLHLAALMVLVTGLWKKLRTEYLAVFLFFIPYFIMAALRLGIRIEEMRNWIPIIPFVTVLALILFTGLKNPLFTLSNTVLKEK